MASPRSASLTILSKMRRCASRKKSCESITSAARLNASLWSRMAPRTDRSASRLWGSVRSATASAMKEPRVLRFPGALRDPPHLPGAGDLAVQLDRDVDVADLLDRFGQLQLATLDREALGGQRFRDVS